MGPYQRGEFCVKTPTLFIGYLGAAANENIFDSEGWFHTGDLGYYDQDEDFFIVGRLKELIKYRIAQVRKLTRKPIFSF